MNKNCGFNTVIVTYASLPMETPDSPYGVSRVDRSAQLWGMEWSREVSGEKASDVLRTLWPARWTGPPPWHRPDTDTHPLKHNKWAQNINHKRFLTRYCACWQNDVGNGLVSTYSFLRCTSIQVVYKLCSFSQYTRLKILSINILYKVFLLIQLSRYCPQHIQKTVITDS